VNGSPAGRIPPTPDATPAAASAPTAGTGGSFSSVRCPWCAGLEDKVVDSRLADDGGAIRRRRECLECERRFTTYERVEETLPLVV